MAGIEGNLERHQIDAGGGPRGSGARCVSGGVRGSCGPFFYASWGSCRRSEREGGGEMRSIAPARVFNLEPCVYLVRGKGGSKSGCGEQHGRVGGPRSDYFFVVDGLVPPPFFLWGDCGGFGYRAHLRCRSRHRSPRWARLSGKRMAPRELMLSEAVIRGVRGYG